MAILSPAKTMYWDQAKAPIESSRARLGTNTTQLAGELRGYTAKRLGSLMSISDKLANLNRERWQSFGNKSNPRGPAAICFRGDVYQGLEAWTLDKRALAWAQDHVRILSGLYGLLRPMDVIQPYRLGDGNQAQDRCRIIALRLLGRLHYQDTEEGLEVGQGHVTDQPGQRRVFQFA